MAMFTVMRYTLFYTIIRSKTYLHKTKILIKTSEALEYNASLICFISQCEVRHTNGKEGHLQLSTSSNIQLVFALYKKIH